MAYKTSYITPSHLKQLLSYDRNTGLLLWKQRDASMFTSESQAKTWNTRFSGKITGCSGGYGYVKISVLGQRFQAHRVIWAIVHGTWPREIDHTNHDRSDNRLSNLREVDAAENRKNTSISKRNTSGVVGVHWDTATQQWRARIKANGKTEHLGLFTLFEEAKRVRKEAEIRLCFHENHGAN